MNNISKSVSIILILFGMGVSVYADDAHPVGIRLDGTIGNFGKLDLPGPGYEIKAEFGKQTGANLFHSFGQFNIHKGESAMFSGSDSVRNIISRVTGGNPSWIDGKLGSAIPNADLYFLNPAGVMFGANASLDLGGSFHVSTADYLRLGENERFYAMPQADELLSAASPAAFGFLDDSISQISLEGRGKIKEQEWDGNPAGLSVSEGKTISLVGGDIEIKNGSWFMTFEMGELGFMTPYSEKMLGSLTAPGGQINMASIASAGEVSVENGKPDIGDMKGGNITISGKSLLDVSGQGAGNVFIRSGKFVSDDSAVYAKTYGDKDGGGIEIQADTISFENGSEINGNAYGGGKGGDVELKASESLTFSGADERKNASRIFLETHSKIEGAGDTGSLDISAKNILFSDGAYISSGTFGTGNGGKLTFRAEDDISFGGVSNDSYLNYFLRLYISNNPVNPQAAFGGIFSNVHAFSTGGNSGDIEMKSDNLFLSDAASIFSTTVGPGNSGHISIQAADSVMLTDAIGPRNWTGGISATSASPRPGSVTGNAGYISLESGSLTVKDGRFIVSNVGNDVIFYDLGFGNSGEVNIRVSGDIVLSGVCPYGNIYPIGSGIGASGSGNNGDFGNVFIEAHSLTIEDGAKVTAATFGNGDGGNVDIHVSDSLTIRGSSPVKVFSSTDYSQFTVQDSFSRIEVGSYISDKDSGNSGTISVQAQNINISDRGMITTSTVGGGKAGDITLEVGRLELDNNASVTSASTLPENGGEAGLITVNADSVRLSENSSLSTEAKSAGGGKISVNAGNEIYLHDSQITSSVKQGYGNGGDVAADSKSILLNKGNVTANAEEGDGGAVFIKSENFIRSSESRVEATSARGNQGTVEIQAPDIDISGSLILMPGDFIDATRMLPASCKERTGEDVSKFVITGRDATPTPADDLQAAPPENFVVSDRESKSAKKGFLSPEIFEDKELWGATDR